MDAHIFTVPGIIFCKKLGRPVGLVAGKSQIGDPHRKPVAFL